MTAWKNINTTSFGLGHLNVFEFFFIQHFTYYICRHTHTPNNNNHWMILTIALFYSFVQCFHLTASTSIFVWWYTVMTAWKNINTTSFGLGHLNVFEFFFIQHFAYYICRHATQQQQPLDDTYYFAFLFVRTMFPFNCKYFKFCVVVHRNDSLKKY